VLVRIQFRTDTHQHIFAEIILVSLGLQQALVVFYGRLGTSVFPGLVYRLADVIPCLAGNCQRVHDGISPELMVTADMLDVCFLSLISVYVALTEVSQNDPNHAVRESAAKIGLPN
jgi:hypothetical protein